MVVLGGCGGGGGPGATDSGAAPAAAPAPATISPATAAPGPASALSSDIAIWGDSLTPAVVNNLRLLYPSREIYNGGITAQTSVQIAARQLADTSGRNAWVNVFWYGHNNVTAPDQIKADIAASVAALAPGNSRFVVLSVLNQGKPNELRGAPGYATIIQLNNELAATYPQNYLDIRAYLISQANPASGQDMLDVQNDVIPSSLRFDEIHLNNDGSVHVARRLKEFIDAKGW